MSLGNVIRDHRKTLEISQKQLAQKIKKEDGESISPQYLNDIELGRRNPPEYILDQLAELLKLPRDHLYLLAGQLPSELRPDKYDARRLRQAFQAFRRELRKKDG